MATEDPILDLITSVIPVSPDDGCTVIEARPDGGITWGHPSTVAALIRDALGKAGLLLTDERRREIRDEPREHAGEARAETGEVSRG